MKKLLLILPFILLTSCASTPDTNQLPINQEKANQAAEWIKERSDYIIPAVQTATHIIVYSVEKDTTQRQELLSTLNTVSANLNALISQGNVDPYAVTQALKVKEEYVSGILLAVANIYSAEYNNLKKNGYSNLAIEILRAVSEGVKNGTTTN